MSGRQNKSLERTANSAALIAGFDPYSRLCAPPLNSSVIPLLVVSGRTNMDQELTADFIDAAAHDQPKARRLLEEHPGLRDARWIHDETVLHFLAVEGYDDAVRFLG